MTDYSWYSRPNMSYPSTDLMTSQATSTTEVMNHQLQLFYRQLPPIPTTSTDTDSSTNSPTTPTSTSPVSIGAALPATTSVPWNEPIVESVHHQGGHPTPTSSNEKKRPRQMSAISQGVRVEKNTQGKPPYSYATLIRYAIENSPAQKLTLNEIYGWVLEHYTYYKTAGSGWKNSIRHNLSLNKSFVRVPRPINEPGKGSYWIIDYTAAEDEQRAKQTYRGRSSRSASDATPPSLPYQPASAPSVRRHSDTRYLGNGLNNSSLPTATAPAPANSASMPTPTDYYYMYSDRYAQQQQQQQQQSYNGYRAHSNNYANVQHHHSCHLFTGSNGMHHQQQQQPQPHHYYNTHQPHYHHYPHHTHLPHHQQQQQPSYSTTSSASSASDRPLSPTPSNLFPPELSVTLSSVTSPHSSLSEEHLGSPLPQHFALETAVDTDDVDHQDKPRKRTKCQHTKTLESDPSTLHWPVVL